MTYAGVDDPIEIWQYEAGVEPRWKWKDAPTITTGLQQQLTGARCKNASWQAVMCSASSRIF
jgi:hypothetical protein